MEPTNPATLLPEGQYLCLLRRKGWEYVERKTGKAVVAVIATNQAGNLLLVEQWRTPVNAFTIELPAGLVGDEGFEESIAETARRELLEETGYRAENMEFFLHSPSSAGLTSEIIHLFHATDLQKQGVGGGVGNEKIKLHEIPLHEMQAWLQTKQKEGVYIDHKIYVALYFLQSR